MKVQNFTKLFDHSVVIPYATREDVLNFAETAARLGTATLTVQPHDISMAVDLLKGSGVLLGTVVGFPHGNETPKMKEFQANSTVYCTDGLAGRVVTTLRNPGTQKVTHIVIAEQQNPHSKRLVPRGICS